MGATLWGVIGHTRVVNQLWHPVEWRALFTRIRNASSAAEAMGYFLARPSGKLEWGEKTQDRPGHNSHADRTVDSIIHSTLHPHACSGLQSANNDNGQIVAPNKYTVDGIYQNAVIGRTTNHD